MGRAAPFRNGEDYSCLQGPPLLRARQANYRGTNNDAGLLREYQRFFTILASFGKSKSGANGCAPESPPFRSLKFTGRGFSLFFFFFFFFFFLAMES